MDGGLPWGSRSFDPQGHGCQCQQPGGNRTRQEPGVPQPLKAHRYSVPLHLQIRQGEEDSARVYTNKQGCVSATLWPVHRSPRTGGCMDSSILLIRPLTIEFGIYSDCHSKLSPLRYRLYGPVCTIAITLSCLPLHLLFRIPSAAVLHSVPLTNCKASRIMRTGRRTCAQYCSRSGSGAWWMVRSCGQSHWPRTILRLMRLQP